MAAGLAAGLIIGGLLYCTAVLRAVYPPRYVGPIGYGAPGWEAYCFSRYRFSILSVEHIWGVTVVGIIADSREF